MFADKREEIDENDEREVKKASHHEEIDDVAESNEILNDNEEDTISKERDVESNNSHYNDREEVQKGAVDISADNSLKTK